MKNDPRFRAAQIDASRADAKLRELIDTRERELLHFAQLEAKIKFAAETSERAIRAMWAIYDETNGNDRILR